jgi:aldehyde dehydrogenase (NAD+)
MTAIADRPHLFIGGGWERPRDGGDVVVRNPATGAELATAALGGPGDIDAAVAAARTSFDSGVWAEAKPGERARVLSAAADLLEARAGELAVAITSELGCPIWFSQKAHVPNPIRHLRYYAHLAETYDYD